MLEKLEAFIGDSGNTALIRSIGFGMVWSGMVVGVTLMIIGSIVHSIPLICCAGGAALLSFVLMAVVDIKFPKWRY